MTVTDSRPCACGGSIDVELFAGPSPTAPAIQRAVQRHQDTAGHRAWSAAWRWRGQMEPSENVPTGYELRPTLDRSALVR